MKILPSLVPKSRLKNRYLMTRKSRQGHPTFSRYVRFVNGPGPFIFGFSNEIFVHGRKMRVISGTSGYIGLSELC